MIAGANPTTIMPNCPPSAAPVCRTLVGNSSPNQAALTALAAVHAASIAAEASPMSNRSPVPSAGR